MSLVRQAGISLVLLSLSGACGSPPADSSRAPASAATEHDPPPFTLETLGGATDARENPYVAWVRTFPGELSAPPEVALGPDAELIAMVTVERRPKPEDKLLDDVLLLRFDADTGELIWLQVIDPDAKFALDTQGNIILAWTTELKKLGPDGKLLWSKPWAAENAYEGVNVATDGDDELLLARIELSASPSEIGANPTGFVELDKLDPNGNSVWSRRFGDDTSYLMGAYPTADPAGNVLLLAGDIEGAFDFGGGPLADVDVLAKYDADGNYLFSKGFGGYGPVGYQNSSPVQTDALGNIFVRTDSIGDIDVGLGPLSCVQYMLKFDPSGAPLWNQCIYADNLGLTPDGGFITSKTVRYDISVGTRTCSVVDRNDEGTEGMLSRYDSSGAWKATQCAADPGPQFVGNVAPDPDGMFYMTAAFRSQFTLPDDLPAPALDDYYTALIAKVNVTR
jgi:hypothetical protein